MASRHDLPAESQDLTARLADQAVRRWDVRPTSAQLSQLALYLRLLAQWNRTINLTALPLDGYPETTLDRLIGEALAAARQVQDREGVWVDLGSGGGSPAVPLKVVRPALALTMVESRSRKVAFLGEVVRRLGLEKAVALAERFETLDSATAGTADLITVRAVRVDSELLAIAGALLKPGGRLMIFTSVPALRVTSSNGAPNRLLEVSSAPLPGPDSLLRIWELAEAGV
jgi:16S rRNA (guanine527-N7)-methyltransferase